MTINQEGVDRHETKHSVLDVISTSIRTSISDYWDIVADMIGLHVDIYQNIY